MAPLTENSNALNNFGDTPIHEAAFNGHLDVIKFLAPLTENPNTTNLKNGETPVDVAIKRGYNEITQFLQCYSITI